MKIMQFCQNCSAALYVHEYTSPAQQSYLVLTKTEFQILKTYATCPHVLTGTLQGLWVLGIAVLALLHVTHGVTDRGIVVTLRAPSRTAC